MTEKDDGGPAFPQQQECVDLDGNLVGHEVCGGMTLRDWFAGQASEGDIEAHRGPHNDPSDGAFCYRYSREQARYRYADAMLAARNTDASKEEG